VDELPLDPLEGLPLAAATPPGWTAVVAREVDLVLSDHAHCELKAASTALRLLGRSARDRELTQDLCALAREEMRHFERVHELVLARGRELSPPGPDRYVKALRARAQRGLAQGLALLDQLVICAFVEARSCERFRLLAVAPEIEPALRAFYRELALAEARHHELFLRHAARLSGEAAAAERVRQVAAIEAELVRELPLLPRIH
jgi:tRNA-(ms[2]io[6]A)-hydroxylase